MKFWRWFPATIWALLIGLLCLMPGKSVPKWEPLSYDFLGHLGMFAILSFLWLMALATAGKKLPTKTYVAVTLACIIYGALLEVMQFSMNAGRSAEWSDIIADGLGSISGTVLYLFVSGKRLFT